MKLFDALKVVHKSGYVFNNLSAKNIILRGDLQNFNETKLKLVDFTLSKKYYYTISTPNGPKHGHINQENLRVFEGDIICASIDKMNLLSTGRKDDLVSLCYLLCYLLNKGRLPRLSMQDINNYQEVMLTKAKLTEDDVSTIDCNYYTKFVSTILQYSFDDEPDYDGLRELLQQSVDLANN